MDRRRSARNASARATLSISAQVQQDKKSGKDLDEEDEIGDEDNSYVKKHESDEEDKKDKEDKEKDGKGYDGKESKTKEFEAETRVKDTKDRRTPGSRKRKARPSTKKQKPSSSKEDKASGAPAIGKPKKAAAAKRKPRKPKSSVRGPASSVQPNRNRSRRGAIFAHIQNRSLFPETLYQALEEYQKLEEKTVLSLTNPLETYAARTFTLHGGSKIAPTFDLTHLPSLEWDILNGSPEFQKLFYRLWRFCLRYQHIQAFQETEAPDTGLLKAQLFVPLSYLLTSEKDAKRTASDASRLHAKSMPPTSECLCMNSHQGSVKQWCQLLESEIFTSCGEQVTQYMARTQNLIYLLGMLPHSLWKCSLGSIKALARFTWQRPSLEEDALEYCREEGITPLPPGDGETKASTPPSDTATTPPLPPPPPSAAAATTTLATAIPGATSTAAPLPVVSLKTKTARDRLQFLDSNSAKTIAAVLGVAGNSIIMCAKCGGSTTFTVDQRRSCDEGGTVTVSCLLDTCRWKHRLR